MPSVPIGKDGPATPAQLLHRCSPALYAAPPSLVPYTNRPFEHQRRRTKRLIIVLGPDYDSSYDYREFVVRPTYDSDLKRAEISARNIAT